MIILTTRRYSKNARRCVESGIRMCQSDVFFTLLPIWEIKYSNSVSYCLNRMPPIHRVRDAALSHMGTLCLIALFHPRSCTVGTVDLGVASLAAIIYLGVTVLAAAKTEEFTTPPPLLLLASNLDLVNNLLQGAVIRFQLRRKHHLHTSDERHSRVVAGGMRIPVVETAYLNEFTETDPVSAPGVVSALLGYLLGVDDLHNGAHTHGVEVERGAQHVNVAKESMAHDDHGAETQRLVALVDGPLEHRSKHALGLELVQETSGTEAIPG
jgi:hypothetical protein